jgi:outer membrane receptor protein involved in Fe transport
MIKKLLATVLATVMLSVPSFAQGRIIGRVVDAGNGAGIADAGIQIVGTTTGTMTGIDGKYAINVPTGTVTLTVRRIGFKPVTVSGIFVGSGQVVEKNIEMSAVNIVLSAQVVTAGANRGSINDALDNQKNSSNVINSITAEQIAKSPDGDAAQAVGRVSGVSVQDGKYVFVRGLGDRYTQTSLNGARIPSPEPEKKVVPLDMFPTGLLQTITTIKTFTPDQPGDFSGAQVDIQTKEFPANRTWTMGVSSGMSDAVYGRTLVMPNYVRGDNFAMGAMPRQLPSFLAGFGNFSRTIPTQQDYNRIVGEFRNSWTPTNNVGGLNSSTSFSVGGNDPIFGHKVGYLVSSTYSYSQEAKLNQTRALALAQGGAEPSAVDQYTGETGKSSVLWGGLANASTLLGTRTRLAFNNTYNRTMDSEARREQGLSENLGIPFIISRQKYVERSVFSSQLLLQSDVTDNQKLEVSATTTGVSRAEPDRSEFVQAIFSDPNNGQTMAPQWFSSSNEGAVRTFSDLTERSYELRGFYRIQLNTMSIKFGGLGRWAGRDANSTAYSISASGLTQQQREQSAEQIFTLYPTGRVWNVTPIGVGGTYTASDYTSAAFGMVGIDVNSQLNVITGARAEYSNVLVKAQPTIGSVTFTNPVFLDVLPALAVTYKYTDFVNFRVSASQTVSRPEYRELAPIMYREVMGFDNVFGNPKLKRALIQNYDFRWEYYSTEGEVFSIGLFAKHFTNPIERVYQGSSGTRIITFVNAEGANNYGVEVELRKNLGDYFVLSTNATIMNSDIQLTKGASAVTNTNRAMVGQAPYMFNTGLTWNYNEASMTVLYNVVGPRITEAGETPLPDVVEQKRDIIDLSARFPIWNNLSVRMDIKNILDAPYQLLQGNIVRERYTMGRGFNIGFNWKP